jgi:hypothetical protein
MKQFLRIVFPLERKEFIRLWIPTVELPCGGMQSVRQIISAANVEDRVDQVETCAAAPAIALEFS